MTDTIKMRRPIFPPGDDDVSGRVRHDDRGNAVWQWAEDSQSRLKVLSADLSIVEDSPLVVGARHKDGGFNPYEGTSSAKSRKPKLDLRALSKWIEQQKARGEPTETDGD